MTIEGLISLWQTRRVGYLEFGLCDSSRLFERLYE